MLTSNGKVTFSRLMRADFSLRLSAHWPLSSALGLPHTKTSYLTSALKQHFSEIPHSPYNKPQQHECSSWRSHLKLCGTSLRMYQKCHIYSHKEKKNNSCCLHAVSVTVSVITCRMGFLCGCECWHPWQMIEHKCKTTPVREQRGRVTDTEFEYKTEIVSMLFL